MTSQEGKLLASRTTKGKRQFTLLLGQKAFRQLQTEFECGTSILSDYKVSGPLGMLGGGEVAVKLQQFTDYFQMPPGRVKSANLEAIIVESKPKQNLLSR